MAVGDESSIRRSIEAEVNKKAKEEKLALIKRTLQVGKRAVSCLNEHLYLKDLKHSNNLALCAWSSYTKKFVP